MSAPTHTPLPPGHLDQHTARLPWWAVALPALAFAALLLVIVNPAQAHAATGDPAVGRILEQIQQIALRQAPTPGAHPCRGTPSTPCA